MSSQPEAHVLFLHTDRSGSRSRVETIRGWGYRVAEHAYAEIDSLEPPPFDLIVADLESVSPEALARLTSVAEASAGAPIIVLEEDPEGRSEDVLTAGTSCRLCADTPDEVLRCVIAGALAERQLESETASYARRFQQLVENAPIGVFEIEDGVVTYVNRFLEELSGYDRDRIVGRPAIDLVAPEDRERLLEGLARRMEGAEADAPTVYRFIGAEGKTYTGEVRSGRTDGNDGVKIEGTIRDTTLETRLTRLHSAILDLAETILAERDIERILQLVLDTITEYSGFRRAVLALYDLSIPVPFEGSVASLLCSGLSAEEEAALRALELPPIEQRRSIFQDEFRVGPAYYIPHNRIPWDEDWGLRGTVSVEGWNANDFLFIPLRGTAGIIGSISVDDPVDRNVPTMASIEPVASLANFAALAVERVHKMNQMRRQKDRLHGLWSFGKELSEADTIDTLCELAVRRIRDDMDYDYCAIWIVDGSDLVLLGASAKPLFPPDELSAKGLRGPIEGQGISRWAVRFNEPVIVPDVQLDERYNGSRSSIRSVISIPIPNRKGPLGAIIVESQRLADFGDEDLEVLSALASQLSVAVAARRRRETLDRIYAFGQRVAASTSVDQVVSHTLDLLVDQFDEELCEFFLLDERGDLILADIRGPYAGRGIERGWVLPPGSGAIGWVARNKRGVLIEDVSSDPRYLESFEITRSEAAVPVLVSDRLFGVLNVESRSVSFFDEEDRLILEVIANHLATALSHLSSQASLRDQAVRDPLTGLFNRHYFNSLIAPELSRSDRYEHPLTLMMVDVDGFRAINNRFGHLKGDEVLTEVALCLRENVRSADRVIRYGGDEFLVFMPETDKEAPPVADRLREKITAVPRRAGLDDVDIGLSIGIYTRQPHDTRSLESILEEVDRRMYADKRSRKTDRADEYRR